MPFIDVRTNRSLSPANLDAIKQAFGTAITAIPGKSESWLMVEIRGDEALYFKGSDAPAAMTQVSIYGRPDAAAFDDLTGRITEILTKYLEIPADRIYVSYQCTEHWGWNGGNF